MQRQIGCPRAVPPQSQVPPPRQFSPHSADDPNVPPGQSPLGAVDVGAGASVDGGAAVVLGAGVMVPTVGGLSPPSAQTEYAVPPAPVTVLIPAIVSPQVQYVAGPGAIVPVSVVLSKLVLVDRNVAEVPKMDRRGGVGQTYVTTEQDVLVSPELVPPPEVVAVGTTVFPKPASEVVASPTMSVA